MPRQILADETGTVCDAIGRSALRRQEQQVRTPGVTGRDDEQLGAELDGHVGLVEARGDGMRHLFRRVVEHELSHERPWYELDLPGAEQRVPGEIGRVL